MNNVTFYPTIDSQFLITVSVYANNKGGLIIFGVNKNRRIIGLHDIDQAKHHIAQLIHENINPKPFYMLFVDNKTNTIQLKISPYNN